MPVELKVPQVGESITEVQVGEWLKAEGDRAARDEAVVTIESEKATLEVSAPADGRITKILKKQGEAAKVGEVIGYMEMSAEAPGKTPPKAPAPRAEKEPAAEAAPAAPPASRSEKAALAPAGAAGGREEEVVPMSPIRRRIAERLVAAQHAAALLTTFNEIDMSAVMQVRETERESFLAKYGVKLGFMSFFVKALIEALKVVPQLNAEVRGSDIVYKSYRDIGIAIGGGKGLVVPVLRNADRMSFAEIEAAISDFANRAKENKLTVDELTGGTFTISNGGVYGSLLSTPIVNPPQSGVLGMHAIQERPVARDGQVVIRPMMYVALSYDHRIVDGREAVAFLKKIKEHIESPLRLLIEL